jgi:NADH-quinone oxidoreductase subunit L
VDEIYAAVILKPYTAISRFLADVIDGRFWHDWFHEKVIAGTYQFISKTVLDLRVEQQFIDAIANGLGELTKRISASLRRLQNGFVRSYALAVLFGVIAILGYLILK